MNIKEQKTIAKLFLESFKDYDVLVAGGAPRDWQRGELATDIDLFFSEKLTKEEIEQLSGIEVQDLIEERKAEYAASDFEVFEGTYEDQVIQFIVGVGDIKERIERFPINASQIWWDGEEFGNTSLYNYWRDYRVVIFSYKCLDPNMSYVEKILTKLEYPPAYISLNGFFKSFKYRQDEGDLEVAPVMAREEDDF